MLSSTLVHRVASVPFLNAKPLVWAFEQGLVDEVSVSYDLPSRLPAKIESQAVDAALVSSIEAIAKPGRVIADGCAISSKGRVASVRIFSKVPFSNVQNLALDSSSMTSNALAMIVLRRMFGVQPVVSKCDPDGDQMLEDHDACLLIGDKGLVYRGTGLYQLDLGECWQQLTGLPFVWACWIGRMDMEESLVAKLIEARQIGESNLAAITNDAPTEISIIEAHNYLTTIFDYRLDSVHIEALDRFKACLVEDGIVQDSPTLQVRSAKNLATIGS